MINDHRKNLSIRYFSAVGKIKSIYRTGRPYSIFATRIFATVIFATSLCKSSTQKEVFLQPYVVYLLGVYNSNFCKESLQKFYTKRSIFATIFCIIIGCLYTPIDRKSRKICDKIHHLYERLLDRG